MKFPAKPPNIAEILITIPQEKFSLNLIGKITATEYWHWDDFRRRAPLPGLTAEQSWAITKLHRQMGAERTPLKDKGGKACTFSLTPGMFERLQLLDRTCAGQIALPEPIANESTRDRYVVSSLMEESITSSLLEGAVITRVQAKEIIRSGRRPRTDGERMIVNNYLTMQRLATLCGQQLTPDLVIDLQRQLTEETNLELSDGSGRLRRPGESVRVEQEFTGEIMHVPPPAEELPQRLEAMCAFANDTRIQGFLHPVIRSIILHFWLAYDHPFVDGNGRTARALFYWSMLRHGFWLAEFISISQVLLKSPAKYYRSFLLTETDDNDLNYFILHQLEVIERAVKDLHNYLGKKAKEQALLRNRLHGMADLNHRQIALLQAAMGRPEAEFTFEAHANSHKVVRQTARTDLLMLAERGYLKAGKRGRANVFKAVADLEERLRASKAEG